jgi:D-alanyl-lipoteichoic acid acyltransferase DltB (MBOAT superfamily)
MLFNSPEFVVFVMIVYILYIMLPFRQQNFMLLIASYIFYGWWDTRFLFLVALSTTVDYWVGLMLENRRLTRGQRLFPAAFLTISAFLFLCIDFGTIFTTNSGRALVYWRSIPWVSLAILCYLTILYALYGIFKAYADKDIRKYILGVSIVTQLGLLGVFKYYNFFMENFQNVLDVVGFDSQISVMHIILPVGISFYTFQSLSYTIDVYRRQFKPTDRFLDFALFVAYFPQLQAGPIERGRQLIPQLSRPRALHMLQSSSGLYLIVLGLFKKVAIADGVAPIVDQIFSTTGYVSWIDIVIGTSLFTAQIYCDFSGYIDIARGVSKLLGIELVENFNHPYFSVNPRDFWRRWNISLSSWLRDYLYIPLGGSAGRALFVCRNLMTTMLLGGLWHGAAWNFVLWGLYQGLLLSAHRIWTDLRLAAGLEQRTSGLIWMPEIVRHAVKNVCCFIFVWYGWLIFRAHSGAQIVDFTTRLVKDFGNLDYGAGMPRLSALVGLIVLLAIELGQYWSGDTYFHRRLSGVSRGFYVASLLTITAMGISNEPARFIYFQF